MDALQTHTLGLLGLAGLAAVGCQPSAFDGRPGEAATDAAANSAVEGEREDVADASDAVDASTGETPDAGEKADLDAGDGGSAEQAIESGTAHAIESGTDQADGSSDEDAAPAEPPGTESVAPVEPPVPAPLSCTTACTAPHAAGRCEQGACRYECDPGYGDCDGELGNGCEVTLAETLEHCGACNRRCVAQEGAVAACEAATCTTYALDFGTAVSHPPHGSAHPNTAFQTCPEGAALAGLDGFVADGITVDSLRIWCSPLSLGETSDGPAIVVGSASRGSEAYVGADPDFVSSSTVRTPYSLQCDDGKIVRAVRITLSDRYVDANGVRYPTVKDVAIRCARPHLEAGHVVFATDDRPLMANVAGALSDRLTIFDDQCAGSGVVTGFMAAYAANVDQLTTYCSEVKIAVESDP